MNVTTADRVAVRLETHPRHQERFTHLPEPPPVSLIEGQRKDAGGGLIWFFELYLDLESLVRKAMNTGVSACLMTLTILLSGCDSNSKIKQIEDGAANVDQHAKDIEAAAQVD